MDKTRNAKKDSLRRAKTLDISQPDSNVLGGSRQGEKGDKTESERRIGKIGQEELDTTSKVVSYEGAVQLIGGICSRLDKQDERLLKYAYQHNDRLQNRKQESDKFIAEFQVEQEAIRQQTEQLLETLKSCVQLEQE